MITLYNKMQKLSCFLHVVVCFLTIWLPEFQIWPKKFAITSITLFVIKKSRRRMRRRKIHVFPNELNVPGCKYTDLQLAVAW